MEADVVHESAHRVVDLYQRHATAWDTTRGRSLFEKAWLDRFADLLPTAGNVLDAGCGGGEPIAGYLIARGFTLTGVDSSPQLIELCRKRFPRMTFHVADMRFLRLQQRFDGIIAWDSFFHLSPDDQRRVIPIFAAHAAPGAALLFTSGPRHGEAIGSFESEPLYHASLDADEYRALLDENGFDVMQMVSEDATCGGHTVWLAKRRSIESGS